MVPCAGGEPLEHGPTGLGNTGRDRSDGRRLTNDERRHAGIQWPQARERQPGPLLTSHLTGQGVVRPADLLAGLGPDREPARLDGDRAGAGAAAVGDET